MDLSGHEGEMPIPMTSTYGGGHGQSLGQSNIHDSSPVHHPNGPPPPVPTATTEDHHHHHQQQQQQQQSIVPYSSKKGAVVRYRECLKNHAASIGGSATDGCGEFMPSGEEGSLEALKCSACSCHRNFHRKEIEGEPSAASWECYHHPLKVRKLVAPAGALISGPEAFGYIPRPPPPPHHHHPHHPMIMPLGALQASESDEMEGVAARAPTVKKRFRTKFTAEQKERMLGFAEMVGWRLQKQEEGVVQQFCQEIGVRRRVLKVWMHNNKHNLARKNKDPQLE